MFTVRIIDPQGNQRVKEAMAVHYLQETGSVMVFAPEGRVGEQSEEVTQGQVYVMNEAGKTVADFNLYHGKN